MRTMTIKEAIGVHKCDIDIKTGEKLTHSEIYGRAIEYLGGPDAVARFVPFPVDVLRKKLKEDLYLNNTPMRAWGTAAGFIRSGSNCKPYNGGIWYLYRQHDITSASMCEGVCILKEAARRLVEREDGKAA